MNKPSSSILDYLKKDWLFIVLMSISVLLFGLNAYLDLFFVILMFTMILINIRTNRLFYIYFALIFFDSILVLPFIGGTFFRVFYVLFFIRLILDIIDKRKLKWDIPTIILAALFIVTAVFYSISLSRFVSVAMNALVVAYIMLSIKRQNNENDIIGGLLTYIAIFALLSGLYGLTRGLSNETATYTRLYGSITDSNYSAMFYCIGLFASFGATLIKKNWLRILLSIALIVLLVTTISVTGLAFSGLLLVLYMFFSKRIKAGIIVILAAAILVTALFVIPFEGNSILSGTKEKLGRFFVFDDPYPEFRYQYPNYSDFELYLNRITSGRYYLNKTYAIHLFYNTPLSAQFFGGNNPVEGDFRMDIPVRENIVSHNSYIDMFFMMGYIATAIALILIALKLIRYYIRYLKTGDKRFLSMAFITLTVLMFSMSISIFPFRYTIAYLLI